MPTFSGGRGHLLLDDAHDFHAGVTGFAKGDAMDLSNTASITLHGSYTSALFYLGSGGHGGTSLRVDQQRVAGIDGRRRAPCAPPGRL